MYGIFVTAHLLTPMIFSQKSIVWLFSYHFLDSLRLVVIDYGEYLVNFLHSYVILGYVVCFRIYPVTTEKGPKITARWQ